MNDQHLEYLQSELRGCELRRRALRANHETLNAIGKMRADAGDTDTGLSAQASLYRADAWEMNERAAARWRKLIAKHIARTRDTAISEPVTAASDDGAIFELLSDIGCRPPAQTNEGD